MNTLDYLHKIKKGYSGLYQIKTILGLKSLVKHYTFFSTFSTFGFPSYLIADVLVFGITSEKATEVFKHIISFLMQYNKNERLRHTYTLYTANDMQHDMC